jgi:hypothetical protein
VFGPIVLIGVGVLLLLVSSGRLSARQFFTLFAEYWPVVLIVWGLVKLVEYMQAKREGLPAPGIGAGGVVLLIFLILIGSAISAARRGMDRVDWNKVGEHVQFGDEDMGDLFGTKYDFTDSLDHDFPANGSLKVQVDRGEVKISPSSDNKLHIAIRKSVYADNQDEAKKINDGFNPNITVVDNVLNLDALPRGSWKNGRIDMDIMVPKKAAVDVMTLHGAISVSDRDAEVKANSSNGDVTTENVASNVTVHMRGGNFNAKNVKGDVNLEGRGGDVNVTDIGGKLILQGEYDQIAVGTVGKGVHFGSARTNMDLGTLEGELNMSGGELRANKFVGPFTITTRSKDIDLEDVSGDVKIDDTNGSVQITPKAPVANIDVSNKNGEVTLMLPANGNFTVDASSVRGEIESDFDLNQASNQGHEAHTTGTVNKGGAHVQVRDDHGTIHLRKR